MAKKSKPYPTEEELDKKEEVLRVEEPAAVNVLNRSKLYTYADYLSWVDDIRCELYNGIIYEMFGAPTSRHARISGSLFGRLWTYISRRKGKCKTFHAPFDVRLPKNGETADNKIYTVVQPDICVICDPKKVDERGCIGAPDLVVEVQSPSTANRDLDKKLHLYEDAGVKEYWVVLPKDKSVIVFLLQANGKYDDGTAYEYSEVKKVPVATLKGLEIDLQELFEE
jgi:Uma2 family endonuclease